VAEEEIGKGRTARRAYGLDEIVIVPSRRTRDPEDVSLAWDIDAYHFDLPIVASAMDSVISPKTAIEVGRLGGLGVLDVEGLWTRYDDPEPLLAEIAALPAADEAAALARLRQLYASPVREELVGKRLAELREAGVTVAAALSPPRVQSHVEAVLSAGVDLLVIQGVVTSAEHVSSRAEPLNLKRFIADLDVPVIVGGCANYQAALHLMRTGAAGVLVGVGTQRTGRTSDVLGIAAPTATAVIDAAAARRDYLDESGGRYVHLIADGGMNTSGDVARALACGADAVMLGAPLARATEAPGKGWHWGTPAAHSELPRGGRVQVGTVGSLAEVLTGPATNSDGRTNFAGALRASLAAAGCSNLKEFQRVELAVTRS
jgi:IMP dehydrogenase